MQSLPGLLGGIDCKPDALVKTLRNEVGRKECKSHMVILIKFLFLSPHPTEDRACDVGTGSGVR